MRYIFSCLLLLTIHAAQAQAQLILFGARMATSAAIIAADKSKAGKAAEAAPAPVASVAPTTTPFTYRGESVSRRRTTADQLKGKGTTEIMALEAALEESYTALGAVDSVQSFLPPAHYDAIITAARKAAAVRTNWDYSAYQQELAFYQKEEARRQQARDKQGALPSQAN
jgi:hypothetical protein